MLRDSRVHVHGKDQEFNDTAAPSPVHLQLEHGTNGRGWSLLVGALVLAVNADGMKG